MSYSPEKNETFFDHSSWNVTRFYVLFFGTIENVHCCVEFRERKSNLKTPAVFRGLCLTMFEFSKFWKVPVVFKFPEIFNILRVFSRVTQKSSIGKINEGCGATLPILFVSIFLPSTKTPKLIKFRVIIAPISHESANVFRLFFVETWTDFTQWFIQPNLYVFHPQR